MAGPFLQSADEVANLVVGVNQGKPVYLREVAEVVDGPEEPVAASQSPLARRMRPPRGTSGAILPGGDHRRRQTNLGTNVVSVARDLLERFKP